MKHALFSLIVLGCLFTASLSQPGKVEGIRLTTTIVLPEVEGRIDHIAIDRRSNRLFVAALGNNTVEVVDMRLGKRIKSLKGFSEPQGVLYLERNNRLYVANGGKGTLDVIDASTYRQIKSIPVGDDADNVRYDSASGLVYVAYGAGGLAAVDAGTDEVKYTIELPVHPEAFEIDPMGSRIFVNVPGNKKVFVVDKVKKAVVDSWSIGDASANFPMAYDVINSRLFVGCRNPASVLALDSKSGNMIKSIPIGGDVDDVFYDGKRHRLYASCGGGYVSIVFENAAGAFDKEATISTRRGARTALFLQDQDIYIVAVPKNGEANAEIRIFALSKN
jgi:YVTN family beta-propeller protein